MSVLSFVRPLAVPAVLSILVLVPNIACASAGGAGFAVEQTVPGTESANLSATDFSGLYSGAILYRPGGTELEILVELGADGDGNLVGTLDMPAYDDVTFKPLENFKVDGRKVYFNYRHYSEVRGPDALFEFEAELSPDGEELNGAFLETRGAIPVELDRIGDAGAPRPEHASRPLNDLSADGTELKDAFNAHADQARLVLLLSPT